jgi:hypothetical protein|tara:strand:+ start:1579 stop:1776 length:198 start_codon:yes stop_codon:yes gene_type:complete
MNNVDNVIEPRVMWDAMVERAFTKFEYSGNIDQFLLSMGRLGYDDKALARLREIDEMHPEEFEND